MKIKINGLLKSINKFLEKYLDTDLMILLFYIGAVAIISFFIYLIGGEFTVFVCITIGTILGRFFGVYFRKRKNSKE